MKRITAKNLKSGREFGPLVLSDSDAAVYLEKHIGKKSTFGRNEREVLITEESRIPADAVSIVEQEVYLLDELTQEIVLDDLGMPVVDPDNKMFKVVLPKEHDVQVEDVTSELSLAEAKAKLRKDRDELLASLDFTQLADAPITSEQKRLYREYRAYLRKLPAQHTDESIGTAKIETFQEFKNRVYPV
jgi:hypothetical protein